MFYFQYLCEACYLSHYSAGIDLIKNERYYDIMVIELSNGRFLIFFQSILLYEIEVLVKIMLFCLFTQNVRGFETWGGDGQRSMHSSFTIFT